MSVEDYRDKIGIPDTHKLVILNCTSWEKGGRDTGYCIVEQRDSKGRAVAQYGVIDERETFPPRERTIHYSRI
ncbi:hypothetical protein GCM10007159_40210 [Modicisalibacter luteus]|nr:hypothetical protein GCM10007159_40210 [Halomonas lutea]